MVGFIGGSRPRSRAPLMTIDLAFAAGLRTANRIICCVWPGVSFAPLGWPGKTTQTSSGKYDGFCRVPTLITGILGSVIVMPWAGRCVNHSFKYTGIGRHLTPLEEVINADITAARWLRSFLDRLLTLLTFLSSRTLLRRTRLRRTWLSFGTTEVKLYLFRASSKLWHDGRVL